MNYREKALQRMIDAYTQTKNVNELINSLKGHIAEYGEIYEVAGISKEDFSALGYDTAKVDNTLLECIARKTDIGESLNFSIEHWADRYGIKKIDSNE
jgi:hypothetical protein